MNDVNYQWLSISLFVDKSNWHLLLRDAIYPFTLSQSTNGVISSFNIEFNTVGGENIRLSLRVLKSLKYSIAKKTDKHFKNYFSKQNFYSRLTEKPFNSVFMPYPKNSIHYGLYKIRDAYKPQYLIPLDQAISETMIKVFDDTVDDEAILTFSLYLLFSCYYIISKLKLPLAKSGAEVYSYAVEKLHIWEVDQDLIRKKYDELESLIEEIYSDIVTDTRRDLQWLHNWEESLSQALTSVKSEKETSQIINYCSKFIIHKLSLNNFSINLLSYFFKTTVSKYNYGRQLS